MLAAAEASLARNLLGVDVRPRISTPGVGFWNRGFNVLKDRAFWKQQGHLLMAWPLALLILAPVSWAAELASLPVWYSRGGQRRRLRVPRDRLVRRDAPGRSRSVSRFSSGSPISLGPLARLNSWLARRLLAATAR